MRIQKDRALQHYALLISGRLDAESAGTLETEFEEVIRGGPHHVLLNMADIEYISSAGIRVLIKTHKSLRKLDGGLSIVEASQMVREVLQMTGLGHLMPEPTAQPTEPSSASADGEPERRQLGTLQYQTFPLAPKAALVAKTVGNPAKALLQTIDQQDTQRLTLPGDTLAIGLGALGHNFEDCKHRFGEFLAVAGSAVYRPTDSPSATPDYMIETGTLQPSVESVYAIVAQGPFSSCIRFEDDSDAPGASLSSLADLAMKEAQADSVGIAMITETAGLVGASLKRSPATRDEKEPLFDHPSVRQWLDFTPESAHKRALALVVGVVCKPSANHCPGDFLRPLKPEGGPHLAHFHACAFTYRALPGGPLDLKQTSHLLFEEQAILDVMHLLNDDREITGSGESLFKRGALWTAPLAFQPSKKGGAQ